MKNSSTLVQVALIAGAILLGVLLDRLVFANGPAQVSGKPAPVTKEGAAMLPTAAAPPSTTSEEIATRSETTSEVKEAPTARSLDSILAQHDPRLRLQEMLAFINTLPSSGYSDALKRIRQITNSNERELASRLLVARWVQNDPDGALQFAAGNRGFEYVAEDVFQQFAGSDFNTAMSRAQAIPGGDLRYRALRGVLSFKADSDPRGALALAATLGEFRGNESLASAIYRQWAATDPQTAALHAAEQPEASGERWRSPVAPVVETWARQDPLAAANWSLSLKEPEAQTRSVAQVMRQWARDDPNAVANWIYGLETGTSRDAAVAGLAQSLVVQDPQTALNWIGTITDESARTRTLRRISGTVMWRDPENGAAMLQAAGLPADQIRGSGRRGGP